MSISLSMAFATKSHRAKGSFDV